MIAFIPQGAYPHYCILPRSGGALFSSFPSFAVLLTILTWPEPKMYQRCIWGLSWCVIRHIKSTHGELHQFEEDTTSTYPPNELSVSREWYQHCRKWPFLGGGCEARTSIYSNVEIIASKGTFRKNAISGHQLELPSLLEASALLLEESTYYGNEVNKNVQQLPKTLKNAKWSSSCCSNFACLDDKYVDAWSAKQQSPSFQNNIYNSEKHLQADYNNILVSFMTLLLVLARMLGHILGTHKWHGLVKLVPQHFCLNLPATFSEPHASHLRVPVQGTTKETLLGFVNGNSSLFPFTPDLQPGSRPPRQQWN